MISEKKEVTSYSQVLSCLRSKIVVDPVIHIGERRIIVLSKEFLKRARWKSVNINFSYMISVS